MIKKILNYTFFLISLFTILTYDVNALQTEPSSVQFYDNYGSSLSVVSTDFVDNVYYGYLGLTAGSTGGAIGLRLNENIVNGHMYSLTLNVGVPAGGYTSASSKNIIGIGSNLTNAVNSYINANGSTINYTQGGTYEAPHYISFVFTAKVTGSYIVVPYNTINGCLGSCENYFKGYTLNDLGSADNLTDSEVNSIINNQTYVIQESINNIENNINNTITDNFNNCSDNTITLTPRFKGKYIRDMYGNLGDNAYYNVSNFYDIKPNTNYTINFNDITGLEYGYLCWYNNTSLVSCSQYREMSGYSATNFVITSPSNSNKLTLTYRINSNANISGNLCINRIDETNNKLDQTNQQLGDLNNNLNDSDTTGATNEAENFFSGFQTDTFGLTSIITAPLNLIGSITNSSCSPLGLQVPFIENTTLNLPCMSTIYQNYFGSFLSVYQTITFGIVAYWVCVRIFALVKDFKNPDHDEIEVLDL